MRTGLKIVSVFMIIAGVLVAIAGASMMTVFFAAGGDTGAGKALVGLAFILVVCNGVLEFVGGLLGLRAAKDDAKARPALIFGVITLVLCIISVFLYFSVTNVVSCLFPLLYVIFSYNIYKENQRN